MPRPNADVRIWSVQDRRTSANYRKRPWVVRWRVGARTFERTFHTRREADHFRSELLVAQRSGEQFDESSGEPASWMATTAPLVHEWVRRWLAEQWDEWQPRSRRGAVEEMSRFIPLLVRPSAPEPPVDVRLYLKDALRPSADTDERVERWLDRWCYQLDQLDRSLLAEVDRRLGIGVTGRALAPTTALRYRKAARACVRRAVDLEVIERDPWPPPMRGAKNRKVRRKARSRAIDIKRLPDPATMQEALDAMLNPHPASRLYHTRVCRGCRVSPGQRGAGEGCFPYVSAFCLVRGSGDYGGVPPWGVDLERSQDLGLQGGAAGDEPDPSTTNSELDLSDAAEFS